MLSYLHIENFTLVDTLDIEFFSGLTSVTGETGAGKSITLDALSMALGDRADADKVRANTEKADIQASFDISRLPLAQKQLQALDIEHEQECILRRVITKQGRSRAYINGIAVTLAQLKTMGANLADIHSQHEHQSLLNHAAQRVLLDNYSGATILCNKVKETHRTWQTLQSKLTHAQNNSDEANAQYQLLRYQVQELEQLDLNENEVIELEQEQKELANASTIHQTCAQITQLCEDDESGIQSAIHKAIQLLQRLPFKPPALEEAEKLFESAIIHVDEAKNSIDMHANEQDNAERLNEVELRLSAIYDIARKHRVHPTQLHCHTLELQEALAQLTSGDAQLEALEEQVNHALQAYHTEAEKLSKKRAISAKKLSTQVNSKLKLLSMSNAFFTIDLIKNEDPSKNGNEDAHFLISTQPNTPPKALSKIASGGELSRISLAIQVVTAQTSNTPTLVFDEVDVGIGGPTGDIVGELLKELGESGQVICVTHLAQVASKAHKHLLVDKEIKKKSVTSKVEYIEGEQVVLELARMMGGDTQSKQSLAHAKQMLSR